MQRILPVLARKKVKVITNMGAANPLSAMRKAAEMAESLGLHGLKIAAVTGDDVFDRLDRYADCTVIETGQPLRALQGEKLSANAYIGAAGIVEALQNGADVIITGRVAGPGARCRAARL